MRACAGFFILISLLVLVGTAGAAGIPDTVNVTNNSPWIIANNIDQSIITVTVLNTTPGYSGAVQGVTVNLAVDPLYGTLDPTTVTTNPSGMASSTFKVKTKSGAPEITATIYATTISNSTIQNIDHDTPYYDPSFSQPLFTYPSQGNATEEVPFKISMYDRWGNPIDNRRGNHTIGLHVSSPLIPDDCGFKDGSVYKHDISLPLDVNGNLTVNVRLTSKIGNNYVRMDGIGDISFKTVPIKVLSAPIPFSMTGSISNGGILPVGSQRFTIDYYLYDFYSNPMANRSIWISTNLSGETTPMLYTSDATGLIRFYYGPKISILTSNITAIAADNSSVTKSLIAKFVSSDVPSNLLLVVTPQTMASRDCDAVTMREANVVAILSDDFGNPLTTSQDVTFTISGISTSSNNAPPYPSFESGSQIQTKTIKTDGNGNAILTFYPGSFIADSDSSSGFCTISATSSGLSAVPVLVEWKNFAYLSVVVNATPQTVIVNETIDVTLRVTGDGYKMVSNPITVVLDMDTTSSMNSVASGDKTNVGGNGLKRFPNSKLAAQYFVRSLNATDQVGLVTYGYYDNFQYWQLITNTSYNHDLVNSSINALIESGGLDVSIGDSVHEAVTRIKSNPLRPYNEIGAIITIGDSAYNNDITTLNTMVQETWTNNGIRIYSILYVSDENNCDGNYANQMIALTTAAHGQFYCNSSLGDVMASFDKVRQNLSEIAGVNTSMNLDFEHVTVNSNTSWSGGDVFDYVVVDDGMTSPNSRTTILWPNSTRTFENQTDDWNDDFNLNFTIDTIKVKQSWETTFRLKVKKEGLIDLFGPGSTISYNDMPGNLRLPLTIITSNNNTIPKGIQSGALSITDLYPKESDNLFVPDSVSMHWNLNYTGFDTVTETYYYSYNGLPFVEFGSTPNIPSTDGVEIPRSRNLDVTKFPPGEYRIKVIATVPGIPPAEDSGAFTKPGEPPKVSIQLK